MNIIVLDFETYYSDELGFKKQTTEEYVRHTDFEVIGVSVKQNDEDTVWFSGTYEEIKEFLEQYDWVNSALLAHNTKFDGFIMSEIFDVYPKVYLDTLSMARAIHGVDVGASLASLADKYQVGVKGKEVLDAKGKRRIDFTIEELEQYGNYCINDTEMTRKIFDIFMHEKKFPKLELKVIDITLRMFIRPVLELNLPLLESHLVKVKEQKAKLLEACEADKDTLMSNDKFAELLKKLNVVPPTKISLKTSKEAWAFAKTDPGFKALEEYPDIRVQTLVAARLGNKTTLEETRTQRFIDICNRGNLPVPIKYYAAHTGRWGGDDKINLQNLPARGANGNTLKRAIEAPEGWMLIDCDSSQIEARILAWLAEQNDLVEGFARGEDVYKIMASTIYNKPVEEISKDERFVGKTTILGSGFGMGAVKFQKQLKSSTGIDLTMDECEHIIKVYRTRYINIPKLWKQASQCLEGIISGSVKPFGKEGVVKFDPNIQGFILPNGLQQRYPELNMSDGDKGKQFEYRTRNGMSKIYGGKLVENIVQALARCVIAEQMIEINKHYDIVLTVHDSLGCIVKEYDVEEASKYIETCMRTTPKWAEGLPLNCESGVGRSYGDC